MKEKTLSQILKELRIDVLNLTQPEMAVRLGMKPQMYALYERGNYDNVKTVTVRRKKLFNKIEELKNQTHTPKAGSQSSDIRKVEMEERIQKLTDDLIEKMKMLDMATKIINYQEQELRTYRKGHAHSVSPLRRKN